jgi:hypothetical protein
MIKMTELLATNPTLEGLKKSIAKYWFTTPDKIEFLRGKVKNDGKIIKNFRVETHLDGYKFIYRED